MPSSSRAIFIRAYVFVFTKGQIFFVWVLVFFVSTIFLIHFYLVHKRKTEKQLYYQNDWEVLIMLYYFSWYNKTQSDSFLFQLETTMQWLRKFKQKIIWDEKCLEKYWKGFLLLSRFKDVLAGTFSENK